MGGKNTPMSFGLMTMEYGKGKPSNGFFLSAKLCHCQQAL
jgi:hypothetical protein